MVMKLLNYDLGHDRGAELIGLGHHWDLCKTATFTGYRQDPSDRSLVLGFMAGSGANPWGDPDNRWAGLSIRFDEVESFILLSEKSIASHDRVVSLIQSASPDSDVRVELAGGTAFSIRAGSSRLVPCGRRDLTAISLRPREEPGLSDH